MYTADVYCSVIMLHSIFYSMANLKVLSLADRTWHLYCCPTYLINRHTEITSSIWYTDRQNLLRDPQEISEILIFRFKDTICTLHYVWLHIPQCLQRLVLLILQSGSFCTSPSLSVRLKLLEGTPLTQCSAAIHWHTYIQSCVEEHCCVKPTHTHTPASHSTCQWMRVSVCM